MYGSANSRGPTISSLISTQSHLSQTSSSLSATSTVMSTPPLSPAAIRISRDYRLFEHLIPKIGQVDRMTLLNWFLEEDNLKKYEVFKKEFYEDPDEYNYALSSLLGTLVWDVTPVTPNVGTIGTFVAPNMGRRNVLLPFQSALTEKWKAIGAAFQYSWLSAMQKPHRDALIMRSFIDTANINEEMANARRQSFDLRTSELSGRGFIAFIQEHTLQPNASQSGGIPVSLPHTEGMVRIFKDWVEKSGPPDDENSNDALFKRSCALSLRDKCIYSRALFSTRLCLMVLEKWEQMIRTVEIGQNKATKPTPVLDYTPPVTTVTEVENTAKSSKTKKKKKAKTGKKAKKSSPESANAPATAETENARAKLEEDELELPGSDNESVVINFTDDTKSSGISSPTGTCGEESKLSESTAVDLKQREKGTTTNGMELDTKDLVEDVARIMESQSQIKENMEEAIPGDDVSKDIKGLGKSSNEGFRIDAVAHTSSSSGPQRSDGAAITSQDRELSVSSEQASAFTDSNFPVWEDYPDQDKEWNHVVGRKRKNQATDKTRTGLNNLRHNSRKQSIEQRQPLSTVQKAPFFTKANSQLNTPGFAKSARLQSQHIRAHSSDKLERTGHTDNLAIGGSNKEPIVSEPLSAEQTPKEACTSINSGAGASGTARQEDQADRTVSSNADEVLDKPNSPHVGSRKGSLAGSEATDASLPAAILDKQKKRVPRSKGREKQKLELEANATAEVQAIQQPDPINLETVTFFCALCHRPRSYHASVQCALCGPKSTIRYCSVSCQRADTEHWRLCGLSPFPLPAIFPESSVPAILYACSTSWMTPAFARQRIFLAEEKDTDYFLFHSKASAPKHRLTFIDEQHKTKVKKLLAKVFSHQDPRGVILLYRVIRSHLEKTKLDFSPDELASQLFSEFGVDPAKSAISKDLNITAQDWARLNL